MRLRSANFYYAALSVDHAGLLLRRGLGLLVGGRWPDGTAWSRRCEEVVAEMMGSKWAFTFPSARAALYATLRAVGIGPGDEVLVTGFTCVAVPAPVVFLGAQPVYVDIDHGTLNLDPEALEGRISTRTKAVIMQHAFGNPAGIDRVMDLARRHGLFVVEDCALALGSMYGGRPLGVWGDAGLISFELSKTISAGWGGIVWTSRDDVAAALARIQATSPPVRRAEAARRALQVGLSYALYHPALHRLGRYAAAALYQARLFRVSTSEYEAGGRMPRDYLCRHADVHWEALISQLKRLEAMVQRSRGIAAGYRLVLKEHGLRTFPVVPDEASPAWIRFPLLVADRSDFERRFARWSLPVGRWFDSPVSGAADPRVFGYTRGDCPRGEFASTHVINLPTHARLSGDDVRRLTEALDEYLRTHPENLEFAGRVAEGRLESLPARMKT